MTTYFVLFRTEQARSPKFAILRCEKQDNKNI